MLSAAADKAVGEEAMPLDVVAILPSK